MRKYVIVILLLISSLTYAETPRDKQIEKFREKNATKQAGKTETDKKEIYVGMTKKELYEVYPPSCQRGYFKMGSEQWIVFEDYVSENPDDKIMFYLRNYRVRAWSKNGAKIEQIGNRKNAKKAQNP